MAISQANGHQTFTLNLYKKLLTNTENLFFAPYSIWTVLAMLSAGAVGMTRDEILHCLGRQGDDDGLHKSVNTLNEALLSRNQPSKFEQNCLKFERTSIGVPPDSFGFHLSVANAIWLQEGYPCTQAFLELLSIYYKTTARYVDFARNPIRACDTINEWVHQETHGRISKLLSPELITDKLKLLLANAVYFKARWLHPFNEMETAEESFHLLDGSSVPAQMMHESSYYHYYEEPLFQAIDLPYSGEKLAMTILLPGAGNFEKFEQTVTPELIENCIRKWESSGPFHPQGVSYVNLRLPRFKIESTIALQKSLMEMGMRRTFTREADFSLISKASDFYLFDLFHKTFVTVDEHGTEAAAVTMGLVGMGIPPKPIEFHIDRPFLFLIRDIPTGTWLFLGRVLRPE